MRVLTNAFSCGGEWCGSRSLALVTMTSVPLSEEAMMATIADLVALAPRATGTPGGERAADYVQSRLDAAGLRTEVL